ncbi:hypothetical protein EVJ58_g1087 [Rhodofomes roseus]|uniref:Uncharacterized protein n=1 Tax=Rhodofomes roseus TaxID=34475 RepID=A0A4Y9Z4N2_9APHY|nr:hypothetical protein EVJ58_g1087 [Rhodofomes roseus]
MSDDELEPHIDVRQLTSDDVHTVKLLIMAQGPGPINLTLRLCNHGPQTTSAQAQSEDTTLQEVNEDETSTSDHRVEWPVDSQGLPTTQAVYQMAGISWPSTAGTTDAAGIADARPGNEGDADDSATETDGSQASGVYLFGNINSDRFLCNFHLKRDTSIAEGTNGDADEGSGGPGMAVDVSVPRTAQSDWPPSPSSAVRDAIDYGMPAPWHTPRAARIADASAPPRAVTPPPAVVPDPRTPRRISAQYGTEAWAASPWNKHANGAARFPRRGM